MAGAARLVRSHQAICIANLICGHDSGPPQEDGWTLEEEFGYLETGEAGFCIGSLLGFCFMKVLLQRSSGRSRTWRGYQSHLACEDRGVHQRAGKMQWKLFSLVPPQHDPGWVEMMDVRFHTVTLHPKTFLVPGTSACILRWAVVRSHLFWEEHRLLFICCSCLVSSGSPGLMMLAYVRLLLIILCM